MRRLRRLRLLVAGLVLVGVAAAIWLALPSPIPSPLTAWRHRPWTADARTARVDPASSRLVRRWLAHGSVRSPKLLLRDGYAIAWVEARGSDPRYTIRQTRLRFPLDSKVPIPRGTQPAPGGDAHLTIYDTAHDRVHDLWLASYDADTGTWSAGSGTSYPIGHAPPAGKGSVAASVPPLALAIWPEEIRSGAVDHALAFTSIEVAPHVFRYPATHTDGQGRPGDLPMGSWLRLAPDAVPDPNWPRWVRVIFAALQDHGMFLVDSGGSLGIYGVDPVNGGLQWSAVGLRNATAELPSDFPWRKLQLLAPPG
jgi:hypothetical protein